MSINWWPEGLIMLTGGLACGKTVTNLSLYQRDSFNSSRDGINSLNSEGLRENTFLISNLSLHSGEDAISVAMQETPVLGTVDYYLYAFNRYVYAFLKQNLQINEIDYKAVKRIRKILQALIRILNNITAQITRFATDGLHLIEPLIRSALHYLVNISKIEKVSGLTGSHPICNSLTFQPCQNYHYPI